MIQRKSLKVVILQVQSASSTSVGGGKSPSKGLAKSSSGGGQARQRKGASGAVTRRAPTSAAGGGMWKFYTEDSPGLKVYVYKMSSALNNIIYVNFSHYFLLIFVVVQCLSLS